MVVEYIAVDGEDAQALPRRQGAAIREVLEWLHANHSAPPETGQAEAGQPEPLFQNHGRGANMPDMPATPPAPRSSWAPPVPGRPWATDSIPDAAALPVTVPVAWLGRTSTDDAVQDPTLSLPRHLRNARAALPQGWAIVAHFYDVESGRKELHERGNSLAHQQFKIPIPRDGSVVDLLDEAQRPDRRFAAVICESIERVARRTYFGTKIEYELEQAGVALCAAAEPIVTGSRAKRATPALTRRVKQAVTEWYVLRMLELSWDGFIEHVSQG